MQNIISLNVVSWVSEKGFSLDELIYQTSKLFKEGGLADFVSLILQLTDELICMKMTQAKHENCNIAGCFNHPRYEYQGRLKRSFRTSVGKVEIEWRRLRCRSCGSTTIPLRSFLSLEPYQSKSLELERIVTEVVSEQSYRRSSSHLFTGCSASSF